MEKNEATKKKVDKNYVAKSRIKRRILKNVWLVRSLLIAGILIFFMAMYSLLGQILGGLTASDYFSYAKNFVFTPEASARKFKDRTNILILGKGGESHDAPDLTDTIIFSSISHEKQDLILLSLPRDIWVSEIRAKLNSAYYWGNQKEDGGGLILAKAVAEEVVGEPIHYAVVVDFSGFKKLIDTLGGVEVEIETAFVDEKFPILGKEDDECGGDPEFKCRYETISFESGKQKMDGEKALKFARSRNSQGDEGTDLARAKRQQKVISAIKDKTLSWEVYSSPRKIGEILAILKSNIETDMLDNAGAVLSRRVFQTRDQIKSFVVPESFMESPGLLAQYDFLYVFIPSTGSWEDLYKWVEKILY